MATFCFFNYRGIIVIRLKTIYTKGSTYKNKILKSYLENTVSTNGFAPVTLSNPV